MHNNINVNVSGPVQPTSTYKTVVLKGNHSFASQVTEPNMKYVIKYDFDLGGEGVTILKKCILEFDGGALYNGTVNCNNTIITGNKSGNAAFSGMFVDERLDTFKENIDTLSGEVSHLNEAVGEGGSVDQRIADEGAKHYLKSETYSRTQLDTMITTPNQGYVTVVADDETTPINIGELIDTQAGESAQRSDTIYRVANWDGSEYTTTSYTEYAWDGSVYRPLSSKNVGIDEVPTHRSKNFVESGGVKKAIDESYGKVEIPQIIRKYGANWLYPIADVSGSAGHKAVIRLDDPDNIITGATLYYGDSATGDYVFLNSNTSKLVTFTDSFDALTMFIADDWVLLPSVGSTGNIKIILEYEEGAFMQIKELNKKVEGNKSSSDIEITEIEHSVVGDLICKEQFFFDFSSVNNSITFDVSAQRGEILNILFEDIDDTFINADVTVPIYEGNSVSGTYHVVVPNKTTQYIPSQDVTSLTLYLNKAWIKESAFNNANNYKVTILKNNGMSLKVGVLSEKVENINESLLIKDSDIKTFVLDSTSGLKNVDVAGNAGDCVSVTIKDNDGLFSGTEDKIPVYYGDTSYYKWCWLNKETRFVAEHGFQKLSVYTSSSWYAPGHTSGNVVVEIRVYKSQSEKIIVPPTIYHYNNYINVYYDNLFREGNMPEGLHIGFDDYIGIIQKRQLTITPNAAGYDGKIRFNYGGIGNYFYSNESFAITEDFKVVKVADNSNTINVMFIGDSVTAKNTGRYLHTIKEFFDNDNTTVNFIGTLQDNLGEGRGGWGADTYTHEESYNGYTNAFWHNGTFDFSYYMQQNFTGGTVDVVFINLGINDVSRTLNLDTILANYDTMISSIKAYNADVRIVIGLPVLPAEYEYNVDGSGLSVYTKLQRINLINALIGHYGGAVYYAPFYLAVNCEHDFETEQQMIDGFSTVTVCADPTHPNNTGLDKIANVCIPIVKHLAGL